MWYAKKGIYKQKSGMPIRKSSMQVNILEKGVTLVNSKKMVCRYCTIHVTWYVTGYHHPVPYLKVVDLLPVTGRGYFARQCYQGGVFGYKTVIKESWLAEKKDRVETRFVKSDQSIVTPEHALEHGLPVALASNAV